MPIWGGGTGGMASGVAAIGSIRGLHHAASSPKCVGVKLWDGELQLNVEVSAFAISGQISWSMLLMKHPSHALKLLFSPNFSK